LVYAAVTTLLPSLVLAKQADFTPEVPEDTAVSPSVD
jgi:hypothetical protein